MLKDSKKQKVLNILIQVYSFEIVSEKEHIKLKGVRGRIVLPNHKLIKGSTLCRELRNVNIDKAEFERAFVGGK